MTSWLGSDAIIDTVVSSKMYELVLCQFTPVYLPFKLVYCDLVVY